MGTPTSDDVLDNPVWAALTGPQAHFAEAYGQALRYQADVAPFVALPDQPGPRAWADLAHLAGPGAAVLAAGTGITPPDDWEVVWQDLGVQLVDTAGHAADDPEAVLLTPADVPEMMDLVERTKPGPLRTRTIELGTYLGIRRDGALIAMAGERMRVPGWAEISAVCTDPAYRGQGLATRLMRAVAAGIRRRDETPFLHAAGSNTHAIGLYESMGYAIRMRTMFTVVRVPDKP
jgi:ribosomal protein S18 acetylase RimI-like enzyme